MVEMIIKGRSPTMRHVSMLTKGNFTRDEWNTLLHLFNISHFSSLCCAKSSSLTSCTKTMAKRMQEQKEEDRIVAKSKPTAMKLTSTVSTRSSSVNHPIASKSPGILKASTGKPDAMARRNSKPDAASSSQLVEVAEKLAATDKSQESSSHQKEVTWKPVASRNSGNSESSEVGSRKGTRHFHMSPVVVPHVEKVCSIEVQRMT